MTGSGTDLAFQRALPNVRSSVSGPDRIAYARDLWPRHHLDVRAGKIAEHKPAIVVWPKDAHEVAAVLRFCAAEHIPIAPFGAGSGVCGGVLPDARTIVLDLKRLSHFAIDRDDGPSLDVGAGVLGIRLEEDLNAKGYTLGHFPSSILCSTVGGWVAARSAGQCSGRYGKIEDMVASLELVTGTGDVVHLSRRVHGPDATPLVIGSEGTLGVVTRARLRLHRMPAARAFSSYTFASIEAGWDSLRAMFQAGLRPAVARLYDPFDSMLARRGRTRVPREKEEARDEARHPTPGGGSRALRTVLKTPRALNGLVDALGGRALGGSTLVLIFEGDAGDVGEASARAAAIAKAAHAKDLGEAPARHWLAHRYGVSYRQAPVFMSGAFSDTMEVAATWDKLGGVYASVRRALGKSAFVMAHLSHAYPDGCSIYFTFAGAAETPEAGQARYDACWSAALDAAIEAGATLSHHHGVGRSKAPKLGVELGLGVDVVRALRGAFDPEGVLNPGNLLPREGAAVSKYVSRPLATPEVDAGSGLVRARGEATIGDVERALAGDGLSLALDGNAPSHDTKLADWIATGACGAPDPWADSVDHLVAGFSARLASGAALVVRDAPRRAVGPDLFALFLGARDRAGRIESLTLRAHAKDRARPLETSLARDPKLEPDEARIIDRALDAAARVAPR